MDDKVDTEELVLRPACPDDAWLLFSWRNDPGTREASRDRGVVDWPTHLKWLKAALADPARTILIAESRGVPVGTVRIDTRSDAIELSWTVAPEKRSAGFGKAILQRAVSNVTGHLQAVIRADNLASAAIARAAGMELHHSDKEYMVFEMDRRRHEENR